MTTTITKPACREHRFTLAVDSRGVLYEACPRCKRLRLVDHEWRMRLPRTARERGVLRRLRSWRAPASPRAGGPTRHQESSDA